MLATVDEKSSVQSQLAVLSLNALKKLASTLGARPASSRPEAFVSAIAEILGTPRHRELLNQKLTTDEWTFLARLTLRPYPVRLRDLIAPWWARGMSSDDAFTEVTRLLALGCLVPFQLEVGYGAAVQHLGIEPGALRGLGIYAEFAVAPGVMVWAMERRGLPFGLAPISPPSHSIEPRPTELFRSALLALAEAERKPIKLTAKGSIYKSDLTRLTGALANVPSNLAKGSKKRPIVGEPPALLWFALAALRGSGVLEVQPDGLAPGSTAPGFLADSRSNQTLTLLRGWLVGTFDEFPRIATLTDPSGVFNGTGERPEPWFLPDQPAWGPPHHRVAAARSLILDVLKRAVARHPSEWFRVDELAKLVYGEDPELLFERYEDYVLLAPPNLASYYQKRGPDHYPGISATDGPRRSAELSRDDDWLEVEGAFVRAVIAEPLFWLGLVDLGPEEARPERFRLTSLARHLFYATPLPASPAGQSALGAPGRVQPSFEVVILDVFANPALVARLEGFADRQSLDRAATYRLSQAALLRGLDRGFAGSEILTFLEALNGGPLPQNVDFSLREWIRRYESLTLYEQATLLEADREDQLDRWLADADVAPLLGKRLGPSSVLVPREHLARLTQLFGARKLRVHSVDCAKPLRQVFEFIEPDQVGIAVEHLDQYVEHRLTRFAVPSGRTTREGKEVAWYRISPTSVRAAVAGGWKPADLGHYLETGAVSGIPIDFFARLHGWGGAARPLRYEPLLAIHLPTEPISWKALAAIPSIQPLIRIVPIPTLALVAPGDLEALRSELALRGLHLEATTLSLEDLSPFPDGPEDDGTTRAILRGLLGNIDFPGLGSIRILPRGSHPR